MLASPPSVRAPFAARSVDARSARVRLRSGLMASDTTRISLLSRVRDLGNDAAWREFDRTYRELILRYARRRGLQIGDAEDVRQAVMLRLMRALPGFRYDPSVGRFRDYLRTVAHHEVVRQFESAARTPRVAIDSLPEPALDGHDPDWDDEWRAHHLRLAMAKARASFEPATLEIFERLMAGEEPAAIATARGLGVDAVYKAKQRVRDFLRERVAEQIASEEFQEVVGGGES